METDKAGIAGDQPKQPDQAPHAEPKTLISVEPKTVVGVNNVDDAPDPDEDDLDDLDDMLDEFSSVRLGSKPGVRKLQLLLQLLLLLLLLPSTKLRQMALWTPKTPSRV